MLGPMAAKRANLGLPKFLHGEEVRVLGFTGCETGWSSGELVNVEKLVGMTLTVGDARPTSGRDGWLIAVGETSDASEEDVLSFTWGMPWKTCGSLRTRLSGLDRTRLHRSGATAFGRTTSISGSLPM